MFLFDLRFGLALGPMKFMYMNICGLLGSLVSIKLMIGDDSVPSSEGGMGSV